MVSCPTDLPDSPPIADAGPDQVIQPQESVTLNGVQSRDDKGIENYQWKMLTDYPYAVIEVRNGSLMQTVLFFKILSSVT